MGSEYPRDLDDRDIPSLDVARFEDLDPPGGGGGGRRGGQKKIVELRLMTVQSTEALLVVPMARIGHVQSAADGRTVYRTHYGDNNAVGYGFCPVLSFDP